MPYDHLPRRTEVRDARFHKFTQEFAAYEAAIERQQAQDRFLDAYSIWMRHRSPVTADNLRQSVQRLRRLDSHFQFPLPTTGGLDDDA